MIYHKNIGLLYLLFGFMAGIMGILLSILIQLEFLCFKDCFLLVINYQLFNSILITMMLFVLLFIIFSINWRLYLKVIIKYNICSNKWYCIYTGALFLITCFVVVLTVMDVIYAEDMMSPISETIGNCKVEDNINERSYPLLNKRQTSIIMYFLSFLTYNLRWLVFIYLNRHFIIDAWCPVALWPYFKKVTPFEKTTFMFDLRNNESVVRKYEAMGINNQPLEALNPEEKFFIPYKNELGITKNPIKVNVNPPKDPFELWISRDLKRLCGVPEFRYQRITPSGIDDTNSVVDQPEEHSPLITVNHGWCSRPELYAHRIDKTARYTIYQFENGGAKIVQTYPREKVVAFGPYPIAGNGHGDKGTFHVFYHNGQWLQIREAEPIVYQTFEIAWILELDIS